VAADGRLELTEPRLGRLHTEIQTTFEAGELEAKRLLITSTEGLRLEGRGRYQLDAEKGGLYADLKWEKLRWPLVGESVQVLSQAGSLQLEGRLEEYRYRLDLDARFPELSPVPGRFSASGDGDLQGLNLAKLALVMKEGRIDGQGGLGWSPEPEWRLALQGKGINPGLFHAQLPGRLALDLDTSGRMHTQKPQATLQLHRLEGELRGYPLNASGLIRLDGASMGVESFELVSGANRARLAGTAGEALDLDWSLQAPELETLWPELAGELEGQGRLTGKPELPRIQAKLSGRRLAYQRDRIGELQTEMDLDLAGSQRVELSLNAAGLVLSEQAWDRLRFNLDGLRDDHHIAVQLRGRQTPQVDLELDAALSPTYQWNGALQRLALELPEFGVWSLESPAGFALGRDSQLLQSTCLKAAEAVLCGSYSAQAGQGRYGTLQGTKLPLTLAQRWMPEEIRLSGYGNLTAEFSASQASPLRGTGHLELPEGGLLFELEGKPQRVDFSGGTGNARLDETGGRGELRLPLAGLGGIQGEMSLPGLRPQDLQLESQAIQGHFKAQVDDLGLVSLLFPDLQNVGGGVHAELRLDGTLAEPDLQGDARLQGGSADIPQLGLALRELELRAQAEDLQRVRLTGSVSSGKGGLQLDGWTRLQSDEVFSTELHIRGQDWVAVDVPEAELHVSPDLLFKHTKEKNELEGEVHIPYARLRPREMPETAVSGSPDLVLKGGDRPSVTQSDPRLHARVRLSFGDRVSFEGMGLKGNLTGNLLVIDEPGRPVTGSGRLGVLDGTYRAYGQDLKIERGYALFADSPVDNPGLDVRAVREVEDVTAGLRVTGTLKNPQLSLFSTPTMGESEILAYLLTGRAPGESSGTSVGLSAALQAAGAGSLASELGRQFGLEELRVDTGGTLEEASVVAGTYLSPRLYVQYVNELATRETKLRLRYDLSKRFQIQTETGQTQAVDLFYTIER
jgi:translocation and assembly module TamB